MSAIIRGPVEEGFRQRAIEAKQRLRLLPMPPVVFAPERKPKKRPEPPAKVARDYLFVGEAIEANYDPFRWKRIMHEVAVKHMLEITELSSPHRSKPVVAARNEAAWRLYRETDMSLGRIAKVLRRDHTTVLYAVKMFAKLIAPQSDEPSLPFVELRQQANAKVRHKLKPEDVRFIRASNLNTGQLAQMFRVSRTAISDVRSGVSWKSVT